MKTIRSWIPPRLLLAGPVLVLASCRSTLPPALQTAGGHMDRVAEKLEEYGSVTISSPLLARPDDRFKFDLDRSGKDYFTEDKAEFQGRAAELEQIIQSLSIGA